MRELLIVLSASAFVCVYERVCYFLCFICYGLDGGRTLVNIYFFFIQTYPFILHQAVNTWTPFFLLFFFTLVSLHLNWMECWQCWMFKCYFD